MIGEWDASKRPVIVVSESSPTSIDAVLTPNDASPGGAAYHQPVAWDSWLSNSLRSERTNVEDMWWES